MKHVNRSGICYLGNAASVHTVRWANYFAERGWKVDLVTWRPPDKGAKIHQGVNVYRILFPPHYIARYGALLEIARLIRSKRPDIIHAHYLGHFGILAGLCNRFFGFKPIVLTAWGSDVLIDAVGGKRRLIKQALERADLVTCDADHMVKELVALGAAVEKVVLIYFGTDTRKFQPGPANQELRTKLELGDSPTIISLRSLYPVYDVETLVRAAPLVLKEVPTAKFIIAGGGELKESLQNLAVELGVADSLRFVGQIPNDELPSYLNSSDIYVSTSLSDAGLAASTAEAMACGLPAVITDFGDNSKWVQSDVNGYLVPLKDPAALASRIIYLLKNEDKREQFGEAGRRVIEERNNREKEMGKMEMLYNELIERYRR